MPIFNLYAQADAINRWGGPNTLRRPASQLFRFLFHTPLSFLFPSASRSQLVARSSRPMSTSLKEMVYPQDSTNVFLAPICLITRPFTWGFAFASASAGSASASESGSESGSASGAGSGSASGVASGSASGSGYCFASAPASGL